MTRYLKLYIDLKTGKITVNVPFDADVTFLSVSAQIPAGAAMSPAAGTMDL